MDNALFLRLDKLLVDTLTGKTSWIKTKVELVNNELAKKYYFSNLPDIKCVYSNYPSGEVIVLNKKSGAVFFCNDGTERMYKKDDLETIEKHWLYVLILAIQQKEKQVELECEISDLKFFENAYYSRQDYYMDSEYVSELEDKLEKKTKAYKRLKEQYDILFNKCEVDKL